MQKVTLTFVKLKTTKPYFLFALNARFGAFFRKFLAFGNSGSLGTLASGCNFLFGGQALSQLTGIGTHGGLTTGRNYETKHNEEHTATCGPKL